MSLDGIIHYIPCSYTFRELAVLSEQNLQSYTKNKEKEATHMAIRNLECAVNG